MRVVIDASAAVKWFSYEEGYEIARTLLKKGEEEVITLAAPDLLLYEVGNALRKGKGVNAEQIGHALALIMDASLHLIEPYNSLLQRTAVFATRYDLTFYGACYGALAAELDAVLVSADPKDHKKIEEIEVCELSEFKHLYE